MIRRIKSFELFSKIIKENSSLAAPESVGILFEGISHLLLEEVVNIGGPFTVDLENGPANHSKRKLGNWQSDNAWDVFAPAGSVVNSYTNGKVIKVRDTGKNSGKIYGTQVSIKGTDGYSDIFYTHLKNVALKVGDVVSVGDKIGEVSEWVGHDKSTHVHIGLPEGKHLRDLLGGSSNSSTSKVSPEQEETTSQQITGGSKGAFGTMTGLELLMQTRVGKDLENYVLNSQKNANATDSPTPHNELLELLKKSGKLKDSQQKNKDLIMGIKKDSNAVLKPDSSLLPPSQNYNFKNKDKITWDSLKKALESDGSWEKMDPNQYNIVAIRNYLSEKKKSPNHFIDLIVLMSPEDDKKVWTYRATTVPGPMFMVKPFRNWYLTTGSKDNINPKGLAIVQPGVYNYKIGSHNGYPAFNQSGKIKVNRYSPVEIPSEANFSTFSPGKPQSGIFGINIHRANEQGETENVDTWSAGCMVFSKAADLKAVIDRLKKADQSDVKVALIQMDDVGKTLS